MKAILINCGFKERVSKRHKLINRRWPPLELLNCAALLEKEGIPAEILDLNVKDHPLEYINNKIANAQVAFISSTSIDRWQCPHPERAGFISFVNSLKQKEKIYLMGAHATIYPDEILNQTGVKGIIKGQPEFAVLKVCKEEVHSKIIECPDVDLNAFPPPAYEKVDLDNYYYELLGKRFALLETSRGCPFQCQFCFKAMYGNKVRKKSLEKIKSDIDYVIGKLKAKNVYFIDLEFTLDKKLVREVSKYIIEKGYKFNWCCQTRVDAVDYELLCLMKKAGCKLIHYGIESGSQRILDMIQKGIDIKDITTAVNLTKKAGIEVAGFFIIGFPGETEEEMMETISFATRLNLDYASFHPVIPYPGTGLIMNKSDYSEDFIAQKIKTAYLKFYLRPAYILSRLLKPQQLLKQLRLFGELVR